MLKVHARLAVTPRSDASPGFVGVDHRAGAGMRSRMRPLISRLGPLRRFTRWMALPVQLRPSMRRDHARRN